MRSSWSSNFTDYFDRLFQSRLTRFIVFSTSATFSLWSRNILLGKDDIRFNKWLTPLVHLNTANIRRVFQSTKTLTKL